MKPIISVIALLMVTLQLHAGDFLPVSQLAGRVAPWLEPHLELHQVHSSGKSDFFELSTRQDKVRITANTTTAAAEGLNWYLEYYCHRSLSHVGDNLSPVFPLPPVKGTVRIASPFQYHYALNYCTINYTMSFYNWKDWEHELDWAALHGVNLMLATVGSEAIWQNTLRRIGYTDSEIFRFIPGPAYTAWWLMGNLEGWGGPVTQQMIDRQALLEKKILKRMKELGIQPVLQGFYGMVPTTLKSKYKAQVIVQGKWAGGFERPDFLLPADPYFSRLAGIYYQEMKKLYGSDIHFFGGDPFHEGGSTKGVDITAAGRVIQQTMQQNFPGATWILQGWQINPRKELLAGLDKSKVLVLELAGEQSNDWERRNGFDGTPFLWCTANNFGEKSGLYGRLQFFADETNQILNGPYKTLCKGIGIMPEGIHNNPVVYDLMLELGWHDQKIAVQNWIKKYVLYRYGTDNDTLQQAWQVFIQTVYSNSVEDGLPENIFCARPAWNIKSASTWGTCKRDYDTAQFAAGVKLFLSAYPSFSGNKTYLIDAIDLSRQVLADKGMNVYREAETAFQQKDLPLFQRRSGEFLRLISLDDSLLSLDPDFRLSSWLDAAAGQATTPYEKALMLKNARMQITYWGPDDPATDLHEYANKDWSGLMRTYYLPRWKLFFRQASLQLAGQPASPVDYFSFERAWADGKDSNPGNLHNQRKEQLFGEIVDY